MSGDQEAAAPAVEDLWSPAGRQRETIDRRPLLAVAGILTLLVLGLIAVGGTDDEGRAPAAPSGGAEGPADDATPQLTSQQAPWGAPQLTPSTLPPGATPHGCAEWDGAFNYSGKTLTDGVYIWSDFDGWHLRLAGTSIRELSGSVTGRAVPPLKSKTPGDVRVVENEHRRRIEFTVRPGPEPVGLDFEAGCEEQELTFDLKTDGAPVPVEAVHLGHRGVVDEYPLVARRTLPRPG